MRAIVWMIVIASARVALAQPGAEPVTAPPAAPGATPPGAAAPAAPPAAPGTTSPGVAGPADSPGARDPTTAPSFVVMDQVDASSAAGLQLSYFTLPSDGRDVPTLLRVAAHARYVDPGTGLGAYVRVPFAYASSAGGDSSMTDVGDIEIGGIFSPRRAADGLGVILRAGITLPTGESQSAAELGTLANFLALPDLYNSLPQATTLKLGVSPVVRSGPVFARLDLGLDWNFDVKDSVIGKAVHINVGVGADLGPAAVMLESTNATLFSDRAMADSVTVNAFALSARLNARSASPYLALVLPLDQDLKDIVSFMVTAGVEFR